jgi:hypothetical protein
LIDTDLSEDEVEEIYLEIDIPDEQPAKKRRSESDVKNVDEAPSTQICNDGKNVDETSSTHTSDNVKNVDEVSSTLISTDKKPVQCSADDYCPPDDVDDVSFLVP